MKLYTDLPKEYDSKIMALPPFNEKREVTDRVKNGLENVLYLYSELGKRISIEKENNPKNLTIRNVLIVGSGARENKINSDIDFLLIAPNIDEQIASDLKMMVSYVLFCDRPKQEAIDVYLRAVDKYPLRESIEITSQVKYLINKYNQVL